MNVVRELNVVGKWLSWPILGASLWTLISISSVIAAERPGIGLFLIDQTQLVDETSAENIVVSGTVPGLPAAEAGVMAGDLLLSVNGESVQGMTVEEAIALIKEASSSFVELNLLRGGQRLSISLTPALIGELDNPFLLADGEGQAFFSVWIPTTRYVGPCPGNGFSPTFNNISALAPIPPAANRRIVITNERTGGYTDRAYDDSTTRSESFDIAFGQEHTTRYFTVLPGQNVLKYEVMENEKVIGTASVLLSVEQRFNDIYRPATLVGRQMVCPAATPYASPYLYPDPYAIPPYPYPYPYPYQP